MCPTELRASPYRRLAAPLKMIGPAFVAACQAEQLLLRIGQAAFAGNVAKPAGQPSVVHAARQPPIQIVAGLIDLSQRERVFIWHALALPEDNCSTVTAALTCAAAHHRSGSSLLAVRSLESWSNGHRDAIHRRAHTADDLLRLGVLSEFPN